MLYLVPPRAEGSDKGCVLMPPLILNAYLAEKLDPVTHHRFIDLIEQHPEVIEQLNANLKNEAALHKLYDAILVEPIPHRMESLS